jgi:hypothetical protein
MVAPYLELVGHEPLRYVAGREVDVHFEAAGARLIARIDRIRADALTLANAREAMVSDYKTVRVASPRGLTLKSAIEKGQEIQLVTYYKAFHSHFGQAPAYLGKVFLRHKSEWRPGALHVLLKVTEAAPPKGDPFNGRSGRKWTDWAWVSPMELDASWAGIEDRIRAILDPARVRFEITPTDAVCRHCSYGTVCGKEEARDAADG